MRVKQTKGELRRGGWGDETEEEGRGAEGGHGTGRRNTVGRLGGEGRWARLARPSRASPAQAARVSSLAPSWKPPRRSPEEEGDGHQEESPRQDEIRLIPVGRGEQAAAECDDRRRECEDELHESTWADEGGEADEEDLAEALDHLPVVAYRPVIVVQHEEGAAEAR